MASTNVLSDNQSRNTLTRRAALSGAASVGLLAVPAGVALTIEATKLAAAGTDPHVALWAERARILAEIAAGGDPLDNPLYGQQWDIEEQIATTAPVSPEGMAIVATVLLDWYAEFHAATAGDWEGEIDQRAGATLARHILAHTPADVLARAGLEVAA